MTTVSEFLNRRRIDLEQVRRLRVIITPEGVLKHCGTEENAIREAHALGLASRLLKGTVRPPELVDREGAVLLIESISAPFRTNEELAREMGRWLAAIHQAPSEELANELLSSGHSHYWRENLDHRLMQEAEFAELNGHPPTITRELRSAIQKLIALGRFPGSDVLGHGDPHIYNFVVTPEGEARAVDWMDFGLSHRWFELAHLLHHMIAPHREIAFAEYQRESGLSPKIDWEASLEYGHAIDSVVRLGNVGRRPAGSITSRILFLERADMILGHSRRLLRRLGR